MSKGKVDFGMADGLMTDSSGLDPRRSAARRTAWRLAGLAIGFYLLFYFLGQIR